MTIVDNCLRQFATKVVMSCNVMHAQFCDAKFTTVGLYACLHAQLLAAKSPVESLHDGYHGGGSVNGLSDIFLSVVLSLHWRLPGNRVQNAIKLVSIDWRP